MLAKLYYAHIVTKGSVTHTDNFIYTDTHSNRQNTRHAWQEREYLDCYIYTNVHTHMPTQGRIKNWTIL